MYTYIYDGTFEGLLTSIYDAYYRKEKPDKIEKSKDIQRDIFETQIIVYTDESKYAKVYKSIKEKISENALQNAYYAYLSEIGGTEIYILNYIKLGFKVGNSVDNYIADESVYRVMDSVRKVTGECHRMLGLLRFKCIRKKFYYSQIEPKYNILELIAPHFSQRFPDQYFIIHDIKRKKAVVYDMKSWRISQMDIDFCLNFQEHEEEYESLWRHYFKNISIHEKTNYKLQRGHMPKYYWKHLIEKPQNSY